MITDCDITIWTFPYPLIKLIIYALKGKLYIDLQSLQRIKKEKDNG
jgi:hypothetical protein